MGGEGDYFSAQTTKVRRDVEYELLTIPTAIHYAGVEWDGLECSFNESKLIHKFPPESTLFFPPDFLENLSLQSISPGDAIKTSGCDGGSRWGRER